MSFNVICEDGQQRHVDTFDDIGDARYFAWWGHICTTKHEIVNAEEPGTEIPCNHGRTDCRAPECVGVFTSELIENEIWGGTE